MSVTPLREESFRIIRKLFYGPATINDFFVNLVNCSAIGSEVFVSRSNGSATR